MLNKIKKMKLWKKVIFGILLGFFVAIVILIVWQWNNVKAVMYTLTRSEVQIATALDATKEKLQSELKNQYPTIVRDFTAEEEKEIMKGEVEPDEAVKKLEIEYEDIKQQYGVQSTGDEKADLLVGDSIIALYSLKAYYLGQLGQLEATVKKEYAALPKEKRNNQGKKDLASKHIGHAYAMMEQCDAQVETLVTELQTRLRKMNADTTIIQTIRDTYENEKALKKAYYLKLLGK